MKKLFYFLTVVILFSATACSDSKKGKGLSNFKNIKVEGTINNKYPVHLQLSNNSGKITGTCVYTESNNEEGLKIVGIIKPNGSMQLQEKDENGVICGTFDGMISDGDYTWKNRRTLTPCASFYLTLENFCFLTRLSVLADGSFLFWFT